MPDDSDDDQMDNDDAFHYLMAADILLDEVGCKFYALKLDGPSNIQDACEKIERLVSSIRDDVDELMQSVQADAPLSESAESLAKAMEDNARLRAEIKRLKKLLPPPSP